MFWKLLESFPCITCHEKSIQNWLCKKISGFFKNSEFRSIKCVFRLVENFMFSKHDFLLGSIVVQLILINRIWFLINRKFPKFSSLGFAFLDWYSIDSRPIETEKFSIFKYLIFFFHALIVFRIYIHCTIFCIHLAVL